MPLFPRSSQNSRANSLAASRSLSPRGYDEKQGVAQWEQEQVGVCAIVLVPTLLSADPCSFRRLLTMSVKHVLYVLWQSPPQLYTEHVKESSSRFQADIVHHQPTLTKAAPVMPPLATEAYDLLTNPEHTTRSQQYDYNVYEPPQQQNSQPHSQQIYNGQSMENYNASPNYASRGAYLPQEQQGYSPKNTYTYNQPPSYSSQAQPRHHMTSSQNDNFPSNYKSQPLSPERAQRPRGYGQQTDSSLYSTPLQQQVSSSKYGTPLQQQYQQQSYAQPQQHTYAGQQAPVPSFGVSSTLPSGTFQSFNQTGLLVSFACVHLYLPTCISSRHFMQAGC